MTIFPENIESLIPQRHPFVMIDSLVYSDQTRSRTTFLVKDENIFVSDKNFCEPGIVENMAQTVAAGAGYISKLENKPIRVGYIGAIKNLEIFSLPKVDDLLETEVKMENQIFDVILISGKTTCNGQILARCEMKIFITQPIS